MIQWLKKCFTKHSNHGFSLPELAISTSIIAMLAVGGLAILEKKNEADSVRITTERLNAIDKALKGFIANDDKGYVPCPALPALSESNVNFGKSESMTTGGSISAATIYNSSSKTCSNNGLSAGAGAVPVRTLKLPLEYAYDGWGRKFTYISADSSGTKTDFRSSSFRGNIGVVDLSGIQKTNINREAPNNKGAIYTVISHGANGRNAAWRRNESTAPSRDNVTGVEKQNIPVSTSRIFIQDRKTDTFDDIVVFAIKSEIVGDNYTVSNALIDDDLCNNTSEIQGSGTSASDSGHYLNDYYNANSSYQNNASQISGSASNLATLCDTEPSAAFSPSNITGLAAWLDASDVSGDGSKPTNSSSVSTWVNKAGVGDATASGSARPTYISNAINSRPGVSFNGTAQYMSLPALGEDLAKYTIFAVVQPSSLSGQRNIISQNAADYSDDLFFGIDPNSSTTADQKLSVDIEKDSDNSSNVIDDTGSLTVNQPFIAALTYDGSILELFRNGAEVGTQISKSGLSLANRTWAVGREASGSHGFYWSGYISEIVVYKRHISSKDQSRVYEYLSNKWGVTLSGNLSNYCPRGLVFRKNANNPQGTCECENTDHVYMSTIKSGNACIPQSHRNKYFGICVEARKPPTYENSPSTTGMKLWLDANDCSSIIVDDNDKVSTWLDKSAPGTNDNHLNQSTEANRPLYKRDGETGFTKPFLQFDGDNDQMVSTNNIPPKVLFLVHKSTANSQTDYLFDFRTSVSNGYIYNNTSSTDVIGSNWTSRYVNGSSGGSVFSGNWQITVLEGSSSSQDALYLGNAYTGTTTFTGGIAEVIAYSTSLSTATRQSVESYLSQKWAISITQNVTCPGNVCSGLKLWLDANDTHGTATHLSDGASLSTWTDRSGNNNHYTAGSAATFESDTSSQINSKPVVHFLRNDSDHTVGNYYYRSFSNNLNNDATTLFVVAKVNDHQTSNRTIFSSYGGGSTTKGYILRATSDKRWKFSFGNGDSAWNYVQTAADAVTLGKTTLITAKVTDDSQSLSVNKGADITATSNYTKATSAQSFISGLLNGSSVGERVSVDIAEIVLYNSILSASNTVAVEDYLVAKWAVTQDCPGNICSNLLLWFDANDSTTLTSGDDCTTGSVSNNGTVGCWRDKSSNNYHVKQSTTSKRPIKVDSVLNSKPIIRFDGSDDGLQSSSMTDTAAGPYTFFAVYKDTPTTAYAGYIFDSETDRIALGKYNQTSVHFNDGSAWSTAVTDTDTHQIVSFILKDSNNSKIFMNGVEKVSADSYTNGKIGGKISVGAIWAVNNYYLNGDIAELIAYKTALNDDDRSAIEGQLSTKWGIATGIGPGGVIDGLQIWLNANDANTLFTDASCSSAASSGNNIACWKDKSSKGNNVTGTGYLPHYQSNGFNSKKTLVFDGTEYLTSTNDSAITGNPNFSVFVAGKIDADAGANGSWIGWGTNSAGSMAYIAQSTLSELKVNFWSGGAKFKNLGTDTDPKIFSWLRSNEIDQRGENHRIFINAEPITILKAGSDSAAVNIATGKYLVGKGPHGVELNGRVSEVSIYNRVVSETERKAIEADMASRWGLTVYHTPGNVSSGLRLWLDANDDEYLSANSDCSGHILTYDPQGVKCWKDKSGNGYNATSSSGGYPQRLHESLNDRNVLEFDGTDDYLSFASDDFINYPMTFFAVSKLDTSISSGQNYIFGRQSGASNGGTFLRYVASTKAQFQMVGSSINTTQTSDLSTSNYYIFTGVADNASSGDITLYSNASQAATASYSSFSNSVSFPAAIGKQPNLSSGYLDGKIAEIIVYNSALSSTNRDAIHTYLASKWGITLIDYPGDVGANIVLWLDGDNPAANGSKPSDGALSTWKDVINGLEFSQSTTSYRPTYDGDGLNGKGIVVFDGTDDRMQASGFTALAGDNKHTFLLVAKDNSLSDDTNYFTMNGSGGSFAYITDRTNSNFRSGLRIPLSGSGGDLNASNNSIHANGPFIITVTRSSSTHTIFINGTQDVQSTSVTTSNVPSTSMSICLGDNICTGGRDLDGEIAELIMYKDALSTSNREAVETYLSEKWAITKYANYPGTVYSNLEVWYDAHDIDGDSKTDDNPSSGASITLWNDKSTYDNDATTHDSAPTYSTNALNSKNVVNFVRTSVQSLKSERSVSTVHAFVVANFASTTDKAVLLGYNSAVNKYLFSRYGSSQFFVNFNGNEAYSSHSPDTSYHVYTAKLINPGVVRRDGANLSMSGSTYSTLTGNLYLGRRHNDGTYDDELNLGGNIAEVVLYKAALSTSDRDAVESYLATKWGITFPPPPPTVPSSGKTLWLDASDTDTIYKSKSGSSGSLTDCSSPGASHNQRILCWKNKSSYGEQWWDLNILGTPGSGGDITYDTSYFSSGGVNIIPMSYGPRILRRGVNACTVFKAGSMTAFYVLRMKSVSSYSGKDTPSIFTLWTYTPSYGSMMVGSQGGTPKIFYNGFRNSYSDSTFASASFSSSQRFIATGTVSGETASIRVNLGTESSITGSPTAGYPRTTSCTLHMTTGGLWSSSAPDFNGVIAEILVYDYALSSSVKTTAINYLGSKWGVPGF